MQDDSLFPPDSTPKTPRKRPGKRPAKQLTVTQLAEQLETTKKELRTARAKEREDHMSRLGALAHAAGLQRYDTATLQAEFAALAKRLAGTAVLVLALAGCSARTIDTHFIDIAGCRTTSTPLPALAVCPLSPRPLTTPDPSPGISNDAVLSVQK